MPLALVGRQVPQQARGVAEALLAAGGGAVVQQGGGVAAEGGRGQEGLEFREKNKLITFRKELGNESEQEWRFHKKIVKGRLLP